MTHKDTISAQLRQDLIDRVGYRFASVISGDNMPHASGDPRRRIQGTRRRWFDEACTDVVDMIIAALAQDDQDD